MWSNAKKSHQVKCSSRFNKKFLITDQNAQKISLYQLSPSHPINLESLQIQVIKNWNHKVANYHDICIPWFIFEFKPLIITLSINRLERKMCHRDSIRSLMIIHHNLRHNISQLIRYYIFLLIIKKNILLLKTSVNMNLLVRQVPYNFSNSHVRTYEKVQLNYK